MWQELYRKSSTGIEMNKILQIKLHIKIADSKIKINMKHQNDTRTLFILEFSND